MQTEDNKKEDNKKGYELVEKFMIDLKEQLKLDLLYMVGGSLAKGGYVHGISDIDMVIIPKEKNISSYAYVWMNEFGRKYGTVVKHDRVIGVFDVMIPFTMRQQEAFRRSLLKLTEEKKIEVKVI